MTLNVNEKRNIFPHSNATNDGINIFYRSHSRPHTPRLTQARTRATRAFEEKNVRQAARASALALHGKTRAKLIAYDKV